MAPASSRQSRAYGSWPSPINVDLLAQQVVAFEDVIVDPVTSQIYHMERRPSEGRNVLVNTLESKDAISREKNSRSLVNGYGGAPVVSRDGVVFFTNFPDFRVYRIDEAGSTPVTPDRPEWRFADMSIHPAEPTILVSVFEDQTHPEPANVINALAAINSKTGDVTVISKGWDFYASPTISPDGTKLAWMRWNHPSMPWQSAQLVVAPLSLHDGVLNIGDETVVAGEQGRTAAQQPQWLTNDSLLFIYDESGWPQPWIHDAHKGARPVLSEVVKEDFAEALWLLGESSYAILDGSRILCTTIKSSFFSAVYLVDLESGKIEPIETPYAQIKRVRRVGADSVVFVAAKVDKGEAVVKLRLTTTGPVFKTLATSDDVSISPEYISIPQSLVLADIEGRPLYVLYYPPTNPGYVGQSNEKPPLIISAHGGPSSRIGPGLQWTRCFYTSRGWGWADVQYGGSSGAGREYMKRLNGTWGVLDVHDCKEAAQQIAAQGLVDLKRIAVRGGSAGGYLVLQSLITFPDFYAVGASHFGIGDLKRLHETTHKFQMRYIPGLIGGTPDEVPDVYKARSPVFHAEKIKSPLLVLHGKLDVQVPIEQAANIVETIRAGGGEVDYVVFDDEGHGFRKAENIKVSFEKEQGFFEKVLGLNKA